MVAVETIKFVAEEIGKQIGNAIRGYIRFIWNTPEHLARWGAIFLLAPILFLGLPLVPGVTREMANHAAPIVLVAACFFGLAATLFGGRGSK